MDKKEAEYDMKGFDELPKRFRDVLNQHNFDPHEHLYYYRQWGDEKAWQRLQKIIHKHNLDPV